MKGTQVSSAINLDCVEWIQWNEVTSATFSEISKAIQVRGMNNKLAQRIKSLDCIADERKSIDLEGLRDVPPDKAKFSQRRDATLVLSQVIEKKLTHIVLIVLVADLALGKLYISAVATPPAWFYWVILLRISWDFLYRQKEDTSCIVPLSDDSKECHGRAPPGRNNGQIQREMECPACEEQCL
ncbi:hypothetical protein RHSIM_Rhsim07G0188900 [Rhododendron simsii]|uniref:Uncharacterized protein n=1 Tax=Rhododendron simsii TaxID=118357 RepID=A0A834GPL8_RHOSS|nr:hypothetical protein RHSIM_Rhsim07G0188900 [Rhododendron simsii]